MKLNELTAISPIDGRYRNKTEHLDAYFSEYALFKYRVKVEVEYFLALVDLGLEELKKFPKEKINSVRKIAKSFNLKNAQRIKDIEKTTNHDIKATEYFIKEEFEKLGLSEFKEFIHFGLTSQDINNSSVPLLHKEFIYDVFLPEIVRLKGKILELANKWKDIPMLAHTHGQPASPTMLGKEFKVFAERLDNQLEFLRDAVFYAKFGGATGNFNAHYVAYPEVDWIKFADDFIAGLGLKRLHYTTQIEHYDGMAHVFDTVKRINNILLDLSRDIWLYISMNYFKQKIIKGEVGSSTMPHKVNPIDFENAEGNLGVANALFQHLSAKLPISRLQRDLSDSTVLRNLGVPYAHTIIAIASLKKGLSKLKVNEVAIKNDLLDNWSVVAEAIQTVLRKIGYPKPYEALKELTRKDEKIDREKINKFIDSLNIKNELKEKLKSITPFTYTGKTD
jgi:adenylosuccinate lyase